ncbi:MAG: hypothetical protein QG671_403 [Actinomycetota bacterium]|jgi:hypothetical protein|nr:hypothetical protein [Actinomycetota bacterium]
MNSSITRTIIAGHVAGAFAATGAASKADMILRAQETGGNDAVLRALLALPDRTYLHMRELWTAMPDVPIE